MALEAVVFPTLDPFSYGCKGAGWSYDFALQQQQQQQQQDKALLGILGNNNTDPCPYGNWDSSSPSVMQNVTEWDHNSSPEACTADIQSLSGVFPPAEEPPSSTTSTSGRRKRRRTKSCKNKEEVENQRMTHIAVERNRRKQMNDYLAVLRSLMPSSYIQRGDQASIIGGAINFVKELEQLLQSLAAQKSSTKQETNYNSASPPFSSFFTFPQYSTRGTHNNKDSIMMGENQWAMADIEVTMVESHANIKILSKKRNKQLLKMVAGFQTLSLTILHLNVTTFDQMVLYSLSVKVEEDCQLTTCDEIAAAVNQMLGRIQEAAAA